MHGIYINPFERNPWKIRENLRNFWICKKVEWVQIKINFLIDTKCEGAEWIYDTDDDNEPLTLNLPLKNQLLDMKINQEKQSTTNIYKQVTRKIHTTKRAENLV